MRRAKLAVRTVGPLILIPLLAVTVPTDIEQPGTQPLEGPSLGTVGNCDNCHGGYDPAVEPSTGWRGGMMAHAARDPLFWATVAVAEQDFPGSGDLCLRCHTPRGWLDGRSTPTDGSGLAAGDAEGVECALCHQLVDPDGSQYTGVQNAPYLAHDEGTPPVAYHGTGMMVLWGGSERMGPYSDAVARHGSLPSRFHRESEMCGTCHDVSNPAVGDLAHNHGAMVPLAPGTFSGVPGAPVETKAAFQNFPFAYGVVERTFSEHMASAWPTTAVSSYASLPYELRRGAVRAAYAAATAGGGNGDYEDGTPRGFSCQTCHMPAAVGRGANKSNAPLRTDLPRHDLTGGNVWVPDAIAWLDAQSRLRFGGGLSQAQLDALQAGKARAADQLRLAAKLVVEEDEVLVYNLTGHKLISGYPEGRRMWLRVTWRDAAGNQLRQDGAYGPMTVSFRGAPTQVESILDPATTAVFAAQPGLTQEWASQLIALGYDPNLALAYDRLDGHATQTLGGLAGQSAGSVVESFHFVLGNTVVHDNRIPAYGSRYDELRTRNALPVPPTQYGDPGPGGTYDHWAEVDLAPPPGAVFAWIELLYQPTSWEYVQFLALANDGLSAFLGQVGDDLYEAWQATGRAAPHVMAATAWYRQPGTGEDLELTTQVARQGDPDAPAKTAEAGERLDLLVRSPGGTFQGAPAALILEVYPTAAPPPPLGLPGVWLGQIQFQLSAPLPPTGLPIALAAPNAPGYAARFQGVALSAAAANRIYATTDAHVIAFE